MGRYIEAFELSRALLSVSLPDRWKHVQAVAAQAHRLSALPEVEGEELRVVAMLHDIGYAPNIARTRFHPLDGAKFLEAEGYPARSVALVARHSAAVVEAELRGITSVESYEDEASPTRDALWYCDATTGPQGQRLAAEDRWAEVRQRYGPDSLVSQFLDRAATELRGAVDRTLDRMWRAGVSP